MNSMLVLLSEEGWTNRPNAMKHKQITIDRRLIVAITGAVFLMMAGLVTGVEGHDKKSKKKTDDKSRVMYYSTEDRGYLGITMQDLSDELIEGMDLNVKQGVLINEVMEGSPAEEAGLQDRDVIVAFDGKEVESTSDLQELVGHVEPGSKVKIKVIRDGKKKTLKVTIGEWPEGQSFSFRLPEMDSRRFDVSRIVEAIRPHRLGVRVSDLNDDLASYFGVDEGEGLLVLSVVEESTAEEAGIKAGDVIVGIDGEDVRAVGDIHDHLAELDKGDNVTVTVVRKNKRVELEGEIKSGGTWFESRSFDLPSMPRVRAFEAPHMDDIREQLEDLRKELDKLRKELKESKGT